MFLLCYNLLQIITLHKHAHLATCEMVKNERTFLYANIETSGCSSGLYFGYLLNKFVFKSKKENLPFLGNL